MSDLGTISTLILLSPPLFDRDEQVILYILPTMSHSDILTCAELRTRHPVLRYEDYAVRPVTGGFTLSYTFHLSPTYTFRPTLTIPSRSSVIDVHTHRLAFLIGMVELLSYWKLACPPRIEVNAGALSAVEVEFWEKLLRHGMGEFFFLNRIPPTLDISIVSRPFDHSEPQSIQKQIPQNLDSYIVLVGGGKDSIVTLELLRKHACTRQTDVACFALNPIPASLEAIKIAGYALPLQATRTLDPKLLELNSHGFLNGHTPFSALLAFVSTLVAYQNGFRYVLASNESSASEGNVTYEGFEINHQYSKGIAFESDFRSYLHSSGIPVEYISFLRPLNELQICALFSSFTHQHLVFRSCNREQTLHARRRTQSTGNLENTTTGWCAECPKCVFTYLCLSCFLPQSDMTRIFGVDPSSKPGFITMVRELAGLTACKPFECVGTFEEVRSCLLHLHSVNTWTGNKREEISDLAESLKTAPIVPVNELLTRWNTQHFLPDELTQLLRAHLHMSVGRPS